MGSEMIHLFFFSSDQTMKFKCVKRNEMKWNEKQSALDLHVYVYYIFVRSNMQKDNGNKHCTKRKSNSHEKKNKIKIK